MERYLLAFINFKPLISSGSGTSFKSDLTQYKIRQDQTDLNCHANQSHNCYTLVLINM